MKNGLGQAEDGEGSIRKPLQYPREDCGPDHDDGYGDGEMWMGYLLKAESRDPGHINRSDVGNEEKGGIRNNFLVSCLNNLGVGWFPLLKRWKSGKRIGFRKENLEFRLSSLHFKYLKEMQMKKSSCQ